MAELFDRGGPTVPTTVRAEKGQLLNPKKTTFDKFDRGLDWVEGSAARLYWDAELPEPLATPRGSARPIRFAEPTVEVPLERLHTLLDIQRDLNEVVLSDDPISSEQVRAVAARLDQEVSFLFGRWATDMLERNRTEGHVHPGIEGIFAEALSGPVSADDPNAEERLYRRWLVGGRSAADLDEDLYRRFEQRYQQRGGEDDR
ncbi:hypothetical protein [Nocardia camponoti]|nr:hypothetical protein [Nocardia camponoti]